MATRIKLRNDTAANWTAANPTLAKGEAGLEFTPGEATRRIKIGDGVTAWEDLEYAFEVEGGGGGATAFADLTDKATADLPAINGPLGDALDAKLSIAAAASGYQPLDSDLTAIAALSTTSFGRALLTLADAAAGRSALSLGTLATQSGTFSGTSSGTNTGDQDLSGYALLSGATFSGTLAIGAAYSFSPESGAVINGGVTFGASATFTFDSAAASSFRTAAGLVIGTDVVAYNGALGTPSSGTLTNCTGLPVSTGIGGLGTGVATALAATPNATGGVVTFSGNIGAASGASLALSGTTSSSSSTTGTVTIGNGTAATNVGIGAGIINAGASVNITQGNGSASSGMRWNGANHLALVHNGIDRVIVTSLGACIGSAGSFAFCSGTTPSTATIDAAISRLSAGMVGVPSITASGTVNTGAYTVATLPGSPTAGMRARVTDANATTYMSTVAGGGSNVVPVFYDGTNWKIA